MRICIVTYVLDSSLLTHTLQTSLSNITFTHVVLTLRAVVARIASEALARPQYAVTLAVTALWTSLRVLSAHYANEAYLLLVTVIVVQAQEPVSLFEIPRNRLLLRWHLME